MGRKAKIIREPTWYAPDLDENRAMSDEDQFACLVDPMDGNELEKAERLAARPGQANYVARLQGFRDSIVAKCVLEVRNYEVEKADGSIFKPKNGVELIQAVKMAGGAEIDLVLEDLFQAIKDHSRLAEGAQKKSSS